MTATGLVLPARYRGTELIASGGMADVYLARDEILERTVAIKVLSDRFAEDSDIRSRFTREARIAARLSNEPNVVTIYDVADLGGRPAFVMEYLPGGTLAERLRAGAVNPAQAIAWLDQAASALDAAHAAGVVHRDAKPGNLMLGADGGLRVTDFGIARAGGDVTLTAAGTILGTSGYLSPEQAVGGTATEASDRYALAVVAFELLSGRRPYLADSFAAEAAAHATAAIPPASRFDPTLPTTVDAALRRGLAKDPGERYPSCAALVVALREAFAEGAGATRRMTAPTAAGGSIRRPARHVSRAAALAAALAAVGIAGVLLAVTLGGDALPTVTTIVRTKTVAGRPGVRTVTVSAGPGSTPAENRSTPVASREPSGPDLNDAGYRLLQAGNAGAALPLLERAVAALQGTGSLPEAYASYNLALARFSSGECDGVLELLERSEEIQGKRSEINRLRKDVRKGCRD